MKQLAVGLVLMSVLALQVLGPAEQNGPAENFAESLLSGELERVVLQPALLLFVKALPTDLTDVRLDPDPEAEGHYLVQWNAASDDLDSGQFRVRVEDDDGVFRYFHVP